MGFVRNDLWRLGFGLGRIFLYLCYSEFFLVVVWPEVKLQLQSSGRSKWGCVKELSKSECFLFKRSERRILKCVVFCNRIFSFQLSNVLELKNGEIQRKWSTLYVRIILSQIYINDWKIKFTTCLFMLYSKDHKKFAWRKW